MMQPKVVVDSTYYGTGDSDRVNVKSDLMMYLNHLSDKEVEKLCSWFAGNQVSMKEYPDPKKLKYNPLKKVVKALYDGNIL
jgi:hypothetical protein